MGRDNPPLKGDIMTHRSRTCLGIADYLGLMACLFYVAWQVQRPSDPHPPADYPLPATIEPLVARLLTPVCTMNDGPENPASRDRAP
jgi:hypothetical protein